MAGPAWTGAHGAEAAGAEVRLVKGRRLGGPWGWGREATEQQQPLAKGTRKPYQSVPQETLSLKALTSRLSEQLECELSAHLPGGSARRRRGKAALEPGVLGGPGWRDRLPSPQGSPTRRGPFLASQNQESTGGRRAWEGPRPPRGRLAP